VSLLYDGSIRIYRTFCGSDGNNAYLLVCPDTLESIIIDAPLSPEGLLEDADGTSVKAVLITHRHQDHWEGLNVIKAHTDAPVAVHERDAEGIPFRPDFVLTDGLVVRAGSIGLRTIHTPGHTPGSVCFWVQGHLFTGDTLYSGGPGESWGPEATAEILLSITQNLYTLPDDVLLYPGHGHHSVLAVPKREYAIYRREHPSLFPGIPGSGNT